MDAALKMLLQQQPEASNQDMANLMIRAVSPQIVPMIKKQMTLVIDSIKDPQCANAMSSYINSLFSKTPSLWALRMLDATAKAPRGLLAGGWALLGDYDECLSTHAPSFDGQFCLLTACAAGDQAACDNDPLESTAWMELAEGAAPRADGWLSAVTAQRLPLHVGLCVPSACGALDVRAVAQRVVGALSPAVPVALHMRDDACRTADSLAFGAPDGFARLVIFALCILVGASTAYDYATRDTKRRRVGVLCTFSAARSGSRLLEARARPDALPALHGVRVLALLWTVVFHALYTAAHMPLANGQHFLKVLRLPSAALVAGAFLGLDTLLLLAGLLTAFVFLRRAAAGRRLHLLAFYMHRVARFGPSLALVLLLQSTILLKSGDGPLWHMQPSQQCPETWPYVLFHVCNYFRPETVKCMAHTWFLSMEWQLFLLAPPVLLLLQRRPRHVLLALAAVGTTAVVARFFSAYANGLRATWLSTYSMKAMETLYYPTHMRFMPYVIGIALGYELHRMKHLESPNRISKRAACTLQVAWPLLLVGALLSVHRALAPSAPAPLLDALHLALVDSAWALGVAIFLYLAAAGSPVPGVRLLSLGVWRPLSRLSYGVYLLHVPFLDNVTYDARAAVHISLWHAVTTGALVFAMTLVPAAALWLMLQGPMERLATLLFDPPKGERKLPLGNGLSDAENLEYIRISCEDTRDSKDVYK